jgi:hypothetical protein
MKSNAGWDWSLRRGREDRRHAVDQLGLLGSPHEPVDDGHSHYSRAEPSTRTDSLLASVSVVKVNSLPF